MQLKLKIKILFIALGGFLLTQIFLLEFSMAQTDTTQGRQLAGQCKICHGTEGLAQIPIAPNIAGEPVEYLIKQLNAFKNGEREHEMMSVVAKSLDENSIEQVANWYASQLIQTSPAQITADDSAITDCIECHGRNGITDQADAPHLAGESIMYIDTQLKAFRSGKRKHEVMSGIARDLTDEQIRQAAQWYSSIGIQLKEP